MPDSKEAQSGVSDLPDELMRLIDTLHERLGTIDHYAMLGLSRTATRAQVRHAFLELAPQFHPDKYFGRALGPYSAKMQRVFAQLSIAHDTLVNDEQRAEYTERLPPPLEDPAPHWSMPVPSMPSPPSQRPSSLPQSQRPERFASVGPSSSTMRASTPAGQMATDAARARQQAVASRLAGHSSTRMRAGTPVVPFSTSGTTPSKPFSTGNDPRRTSSSTHPAVNPKAAVDALRRRYEESVAHARGKQSNGAAQAAEAAAAKGEFVEAARLYRAAAEGSSDPHLRALLAETEAKARVQQHAASIARAKDSEQKQDYADAGANWARAFDLAPAADTAHRAALCFRRAGADSRRAAKYGEEAVKLDPNKSSYRVNLALVYCDLGLGLRARGEIDRAQALDPQSAQVKDALPRIKAMK